MDKPQCPRPRPSSPLYEGTRRAKTASSRRPWWVSPRASVSPC